MFADPLAGRIYGEEAMLRANFRRSAQIARNLHLLGANWGIPDLTDPWPVALDLQEILKISDGRG